MIKFSHHSREIFHHLAPEQTRKAAFLAFLFSEEKYVYEKKNILQLYRLPVEKHGKRTESFSKVFIVVGLLLKLTSVRTPLSLIIVKITKITPDRHCFK